jgi:NB-ARC domain
MEALTEFLLSLAKEMWVSRNYVEEKIKLLKNKRDGFKDKLIKAEFIDDPLVTSWVHQLKSVCFDIDLLLEEYETSRQISGERSSRKRKRYHGGLSVGPTRSRIEMLESEVRVVKKMWGEIRRKIKEVRHSDNAGTSQPFQLDEHVKPIGREVEKNEIVELLVPDLKQSSNMSSSVSDVPILERKFTPVIPIFGAAGIGKTTLAQMVYEDQRIVSFFDFRVWVSSSDIVDVMKEMYKEMTGKNGSRNSLVLHKNLKYEPIFNYKVSLACI